MVLNVCLRGFVVFRPSNDLQGRGRWKRLNLSEAIRTMRPVRVPRVVRTGTGSQESQVSFSRQRDTLIGNIL